MINTMYSLLTCIFFWSILMLIIGIYFRNKNKCSAVYKCLN